MPKKKSNRALGFGNLRVFETREKAARYRAMQESKRARYLNYLIARAQRSEASPLIRFRQVTRAPLQAFLNTPIANKNENLKRAVNATRSIMGFQISDSIKPLICKERKERRRAIFAKKKNGGNHKPPTFKIKSLVRC